MQAYCMRCRTKREMKDAKAITMKNGKPAIQGVCPVCGTKMFRIGKGQRRDYRYQGWYLRSWVNRKKIPSLLNADRIKCSFVAYLRHIFLLLRRAVTADFGLLGCLQRPLRSGAALCQAFLPLIFVRFAGLDPEEPLYLTALTIIPLGTIYPFRGSQKPL